MPIRLKTLSNGDFSQYKMKAFRRKQRASRSVFSRPTVATTTTPQTSKLRKYNSVMLDSFTPKTDHFFATTHSPKNRMQNRRKIGLKIKCNLGYYSATRINMRFYRPFRAVYNTNKSNRRCNYLAF